MAILDSVNELAKRFGVETEEQTISEQLDAINQKLDDSYTGSRDIEEAVSQFAKNDGPDARLNTKSITENGTYTALDDELDGYSSVTVNVAAPTPETFEVNVTYNPETTTVDKTYAEIKTAIENNKRVIGTISMPEAFTTNIAGSYICDIVRGSQVLSSNAINLISEVFIMSAGEGSATLFSCCTITSENNVAFSGTPIII